jgi:multidrug transporter EmrE-like cation transporter
MEKFYLVAAAIIMVIGQITLKFGMGKIGEIDLIKEGVIGSALTIFLNPIVIVGLGFYFVSSFLFLVSISKLDLSFAYPVVISISYISIPLLSILFFKEKISTSQILLLGIIFICLISFYRLEPS